MPKITIFHQNNSMKVEQGASALEVAKELKLVGPNHSLAVHVNGQTQDLNTPLSDGDKINFIHFETDEGKEVFWHSTAHVLAQAVSRLYPDAQPTIGPPIKNGFYYDFANLSISEEDLLKIEKEMKAIVKENLKPQRHLFSSKEEALGAFPNNPYKQEIIVESTEPTLSYYTQGDFKDLCRGPHLPATGKIKALKLLKLSGAYWRADANNTMLTRIYGVSFPDKQQLKEHLNFLEEAKKRDHKIIGPKLDLFSLKPEAPGMPFIHHHGMYVWNSMLDFWRKLHTKYDYQEIKTPSLMTRELWETSGHWANYRENMFTSIIEDRDFAIKPMNCPGGLLHYKSTLHSYRELPLRVSEIGHVHRYEPSGALSGLFRVRSFHQDDAHIYIHPDHIEEEIINVLNLTDELYKTFGLRYHLELSTRPDKNTIGSDEDWEKSTKALHRALVNTSREFQINEGDGAFYGPKIDFHVEDALGRTWQCGTIQVDMALPEKFDIDFVSEEGCRKRPIMIHRAIYGSIERFMGILIEHYAGRFPLWLSPRQVRIITVADRHINFAHNLLKDLQKQGLRVELDSSPESISKKVRNAQLSQTNYILTIGDEEVSSEKLAVRTRTNIVVKDVDLKNFQETLFSEIQSRSLESSFEKS